MSWSQGSKIVLPRRLLARISQSRGLRARQFSPRAWSMVAVDSPVVDRHLCALAVYNIFNRGIDIFLPPEVLGAAATGPPSPTGWVDTRPGESPAGSSLQHSQNLLRFTFSLYDYVNMVGSDVSCKYPPLAITTGLSESFQRNLAALLIQPIGFLFQLSSNGPNPGGVRWQWRGIEATMMSID